MCSKVGYSNWADANKAAIRSHRQYEVPCEPYWCRQCRQFHVGTRPAYIPPSQSLRGRKSNKKGFSN